MRIQTVTTRNYQYGIVNALESRSIKRGAASDSLNWRTLGDHIELTRGQQFLGVSSVNTGSGKTTGIKKTTNALGVEVLFGTYGKKLKYYDNSTLEWIENGSDLLGDDVVDADGVGNEDIFMSEYVSPAGNQMWLNSPNCAGYFKIMVANPGDAIDQYNSSKNFKGNIKVDTNRTLLWGRISDKTGLYGSYIDELNNTTVTGEEFSTGNGATTTYSKYLNFKTKATVTLTSTGVNVSDGDTVTLGSTVYRFKNTMAQAYDVKIGADAAASLVNLKKAINLIGTAGTEYYAGTAVHPTVEGYTITSTTLIVQAKTPGTTGNGIASTDTAVTLSFGAVTLAGGAASKRTLFGLSVTAGAVVLTDDYAGNLSASDGSTGTINYATGLVSITFNSAVADGTAITASYQWEDSTDGGIADFTKSGTRLAGEGFIVRQDEGGGPLQFVGSIGSTYFCLHLKKSWTLTLAIDDGNDVTNVPYRQNVGIPNERAAVETGDGIYYIDDLNPSDIKARLLTYTKGGSPQIIPVPVSDNLNLSGYRFDQAAAWEWGDLVLFACRRSSSVKNDRVLTYNKVWKAWDILNYNVTCFETFNGALVGGDSLSNNFLELFSGFDDLGSEIENYWIGGLDDLDLEGLKKSKKLYIQGTIAPDQTLKIYLSVDDGSFVEIGEIVGSGDYVDRSQSVAIGAVTLGKKIVGGGSGVTAYNYERLISLRLDKFERIKVKYVATGVGFVSVSTQKYWDVRVKGRKVPRKYR